MTYSIMATDPETSQIGYAVASKAFYVGIIGFTDPHHGAVLLQGETNFQNGPIALHQLQQGKTLKETLQHIKTNDPNITHQQIALADNKGNTLAYTGNQCTEWAGHYTENWVTTQGNILSGAEVIEQMYETYQSTEGMMVERLIAALNAGEKAGGDKRGKQSAAIKVVSPGAGFMGSDTIIDLNIYDHPEPVKELTRITNTLLNYMRQGSNR